jgi:hypothetical protein
MRWVPARLVGRGDVESPYLGLGWAFAGGVMVGKHRALVLWRWSGMSGRSLEMFLWGLD